MDIVQYAALAGFRVSVDPTAMTGAKKDTYILRAID